MQVKDLHIAECNPRKIDDNRLQMLGKSMQEFGDLSGIVFNCRTNRLIGGHQRLKHLDPSWKITRKTTRDDKGTVAVGYIDTPFGKWIYREVDWSEDRELAANIAANKHSGEWDFPKLKDIFIELDNGAFDVELTGFNEEEMENAFDRSFGRTVDRTVQDERFKEPQDNKNIMITFICNTGEERRQIITFLGEDISISRQVFDATDLINAINKK